MEIIKGITGRALKIVLYGPEGIGKSTFASKMPDVIFCDTEGSTKWMNVSRTPAPSSFSMLLEQVKYFVQHPEQLKTFALDTGDWAESLCISEVCAIHQKKGIEDFAYGKGYVYLQENFGRLLNLLNELVDKGINVIINCHAKMRKFEQPDEMGAYDRWELKLTKQVAPLVKEWADIILFANYKTYVINVDGKGAEKGKNKVQGGKRVMYTTHNPCWDAKNRHNLKDELPFDFQEIAHLFKACDVVKNTVPETSHTPLPDFENISASDTQQDFEQLPVPLPEYEYKTVPEETEKKNDEFAGVPNALKDLMSVANVTVRDVQKIVAKKGYYPINTPISNYDVDFINGVLIGAWPKVYKEIISGKVEQI